MGQSADEITIDIIQLMEQAAEKLRALRDQKNPNEVPNGFDKRAISVALTELETAQLWVANARPE